MEEVDDIPRRYRENMTYRSLRKSSSQVFSTIKKKISGIEDSLRSRNALQPLNESPSPFVVRSSSRLNKLKSDTPVLDHADSMSDLNGFEFDEKSNLMTTPVRSDPRPPGKFKRSRSFMIKRPLKFKGLSISASFRKLKKVSNVASSSMLIPATRLCDTPQGSRLAKVMADCRIQEILSPSTRSDASLSMFSPTSRTRSTPHEVSKLHLKAAFNSTKETFRVTK